MPLPEESRPDLDTEPVIRCPSPLRGDAMRALALDHIEADHVLARLQRRARELDLVVHPQRIGRVRELLAEARLELGRDHR